MGAASGESQSRWEPIAFWIMASLHLVPVLWNRWFVALDGPCHLYNARIIRDLVLGDEFTAHFFRINPFPEPNWIGHAFMALAMTVVPAWIAEKLVVSAAVLGLAWAFRSFIRSLAPQATAASWLVMPFLLGFVLRMGFFNFYISLAILFLLLEKWNDLLRSDRASGTWICAALLLILYFSHLSTFLLGIATMFILCVPEHVRSRNWLALFRSLRKLALCAFVPLGLALWYHFAHPPGPAEPKYLPRSQLLGWIVDGQAWIGLGRDERWMTRAIAFAFLALFVTSLVVGIAAWRRNKQGSFPIWAGLTLLLLVAFLLLPDQMAGGGIASPRLLLFTMFFMVPAIAISGIPMRYVWVGAIVVGLADLAHLHQQQGSAASLSSEATDLMSVADRIPPHSIVLPLNYSDNWLHSNLSNYIGASGRVIVLDNYAAIAAHHPVRWVEGMEPYDVVGTFATSNRPCVSLSNFKEQFGLELDHVLTWKLHESMTDSCTTDVRTQLSAGFEEVARSTSGNARLFRVKRNGEDRP